MCNKHTHKREQEKKLRNEKLLKRNKKKLYFFCYFIYFENKKNLKYKSREKRLTMIG